MKKKLLLFSILFASLAYGQSVSTIPAIPTAANPITITFDATGSELEGYTGDVYAHTGVLTSESTSNTDWKHVIGSWGNNTTQPQLTRLTANTYELVITPNITSFYNVDAGATVTNIAIVFRSEDGSQQSRPDLFIQIFEDGLNVTITNPSNDDVFDLNDNITITAESSTSADLELKVNNSSIATETGNTSISSAYTFTTTGAFTINASAVQGTETKEETISVYVKTPTQTETVPTGLEYGLNKNNDGSVTFVLQAPLKNDVFLLGTFNGWELNPMYQMKKDGDTFWLTLSGLDPDTEYAYQYYVDYSLRVADPYSKKVLDPSNDQFISDTTYPNLMDYPEGTTGIVSTFQINEISYNWQVNSFSKPDQENLVVYEMLIRDFTEEDSFLSAMTHLDYLENLGINAIELMPVSEFEGNDSWGYNPSFHGALDKYYGTQNHFKMFVDACHERGIAVILDVVYNHAFSQSPLAQMYWDSANFKPSADNPWLNPDAKHPFNVGYDFNHESEYTKTYVKQTLKYWIEEFKVDGFRFDLSKGFTQTNNPDNVGAWGNFDASRIAILEDYADYIWNNVSSDAYLILEHFATNSEETALANYGFMLWGNLNHDFNQNTMGFASNADVSWLAYTERNWNNPHIVGYMESHDEERLMVRNINNGNSNAEHDTKDFQTALDRIEAATAIFYSVPGPKMLWQFGELGYDKSINCENDITNGNCRLDRKPVAWTLNYDDDEDRLDLYDVTAKMIKLKTDYPSTFNTDDFSFSLDGLIKRITLNDKVGDFDVVVIANFDLVEKSVNPNFSKTGTWYRILNNNAPHEVNNVSTSISLSPGEYRVYGTQPVIDPNDLDSDGVINAEDSCPNTPLGATVDANGCEIFVLPVDNFRLQVSNETCRNSNNGVIDITAQKNLNYTATITGNSLNNSDDFTTTYIKSDLEAGDYRVCITVEGQVDFEQCFNVTITEPKDLSVTSKILESKKAIALNLNGSDSYYITINDIETETFSSSIELPLQFGENKIIVKTNKDCQGKYEKTIFYGDGLMAFPNPFTNQLDVYFGNNKNANTSVEIYSILGHRVFYANSNTPSLNIDTSSFSKGIYVLRMATESTSKSFKIIKN
ncbi:T9SS type A sorting domain-containing protein [Hyunsoonleella flava]|uniref:T9SS type A sorting domain-containing protein n=1 Tax=Hyunsoonleella flava TaxID=2527939 RepID=A0A4Q9FAL7_9FLAO|nr:alpha-amylase family glycosyl hydrolase [Hyunsoonleella flava]TBN00903.1 T9SS type A sorting domain-containing protein [Hyunsoonleella flava]